MITIQYRSSLATFDATTVGRKWKSKDRALAKRLNDNRPGELDVSANAPFMEYDEGITGLDGLWLEFATEVLGDLTIFAYTPDLFPEEQEGIVY
jgi:hypothetical protein